MEHQILNNRMIWKSISLFHQIFEFCFSLQCPIFGNGTVIYAFVLGIAQTFMSLSLQHHLRCTNLVLPLRIISTNSLIIFKEKRKKQSSCTSRQCLTKMIDCSPNDGNVTSQFDIQISSRQSVIERCYQRSWWRQYIILAYSSSWFPRTGQQCTLGEGMKILANDLLELTHGTQAEQQNQENANSFKLWKERILFIFTADFPACLCSSNWKHPIFRQIPPFCTDMTLVTSSH